MLDVGEEDPEWLMLTAVKTTRAATLRPDRATQVQLQIEATAGGPLSMRLCRGGHLLDVDHERQHYGLRGRRSGSPKLDGDAKMIHLKKSSQPYARSGDQAEVCAEQDDEDMAAVTESKTVLSWTTRSRRCRRAAVGDANPISDREKKDTAATIATHHMPTSHLTRLLSPRLLADHAQHIDGTEQGSGSHQAEQRSCHPRAEKKKKNKRRERIREAQISTQAAECRMVRSTRQGAGLWCHCAGLQGPGGAVGTDPRRCESVREASHHAVAWRGGEVARTGRGPTSRRVGPCWEDTTGGQATTTAEAAERREATETVRELPVVAARTRTS